MTRPRDQRIIHLRDTRLYVNTGRAFAACYVTYPDFDRPDFVRQVEELPSTGSVTSVTCKHCKRLLAAERRSA